METDSDEWLTVNDAVTLSGYNPEYIRRLMRKGVLGAKKFSTVWQVNRNSLLAYLDNARSSQDKRFNPKVDKE